MGHLTSHATQALNCSAQRGRHSLMWLVQHPGTSWRNSSNLNSCWRVIISRCYYYPQVRKMPLKQNAGVIWWFVTQTFRLRGKRMTELARDISKKEKRRILWARTGDQCQPNNNEKLWGKNKHKAPNKNPNTPKQLKKNPRARHAGTMNIMLL